MIFSGFKGLLRRRSRGDDEPVKYPELFFDLVFVFVFTRISQFLMQHNDALGMLQTAFLIMAIWWVWVFTSWATNWLDPSKKPVRLLLIAMTAAGLIMSVALPESFGAHGLIFAIAYVAMQVGRSLFMLAAVERHNRKNHLNFKRIAAWMCASGCFWIAGGVVGGHHQIVLWGIALLVEYTGPAVHFRTPFIGKSDIDDWYVEGSHMSERCALFVIIALGETILVMGETFTEIDWSPLAWSGLALAFAHCVAIWWLYFDTGVQKGAKTIDEAQKPGHYARLAYTYIHLPITAGIIVTSVGYERLIQHIGERAGSFDYVMLGGGSFLIIFGNLLFKRAVTGHWPRSHAAGMAALSLFAFIAPFASLDMLPLAAITVLIFIAVIAWETVSDREGCVS